MQSVAIRMSISRPPVVSESKPFLDLGEKAASKSSWRFLTPSRLVSRLLPESKAVCTPYWESSSSLRASYRYCAVSANAVKMIILRLGRPSTMLRGCCIFSRIRLRNRPSLASFSGVASPQRVLTSCKMARSAAISLRQRSR